MSKYDKYLKSLSELRRIGETIPRLFFKDNPYTVDIELLLDKEYYTQIDVVPLKAEMGVEAWATVSGKKIYVDIGLTDSDWLEQRYRFTLAEELAHIILHSKIYSTVESFDDWKRIWDEIPDDVHDKLDKNAKELAGIILMPEKKFMSRLLELRNSFYKIYCVKGMPSDEQKSRITTNIIKQLMDDFNVNQEPCRIRIGRIEMWEGKTFFQM